MRGLILFLAPLFALTLAACVPETLGPVEGGATPPAADIGADTGVDGLLVGHRLMASGEYELALRAYFRAGAEQGTTVDVLSALGSANLRLGRIGQAETLLRQALDEEPDFVPALNNLGVVLMEQGDFGEARRVFQNAFAADSGATDAIRENLRLAIARQENQVYTDVNEENRFGLIRRGSGEYELLATP